MCGGSGMDIEGFGWLWRVSDLMEWVGMDVKGLGWVRGTGTDL